MAQTSTNGSHGGNGLLTPLERLIGDRDDQPETATKSPKAPKLPKQKQTPTAGGNTSNSLHQLRETLKEVLFETTTIEIATIVVEEIPWQKFVAIDAYEQITYDLTYRTEEGLQEKREELTRRSLELKEKGKAIDRDNGRKVDLIKQELATYNCELERFNEAETIFHKIKAEDSPDFRKLQACFQEMRRQMRDLHVTFDEKGHPFLGSSEVRKLRRIWEMQMGILNEETIYAQTRISLDGDIVNRYRKELFEGDRHPERLLGEKAAVAILELHNASVASAMQRWQGLIQFAVELVERLIPYRQ